MNLSSKFYQRSIKNILKNFKFKNVHNMMKKVGWKWAMHYRNDVGIPSVEDLKEEALRLLNDAAKNPNSDYFVSCGGFEVCKYDDKYLKLSFVFAEWDNYDLEENDEDINEKELENRFKHPINSLEL